MGNAGSRVEHFSGLITDGFFRRCLNRGYSSMPSGIRCIAETKIEALQMLRQPCCVIQHSMKQNLINVIIFGGEASNAGEWGM